ncbi:urea transporter [Ferruginibacter sp.]|nr:peptidoglycan DD-metalloendopeptidase family protein [Ferruginibacter sp.]
MKNTTAISFLKYFTATVLNSYSMLFFSNKKFFAIMVLLASFFNPYTGFAGLVATITAAIVAYFIGFSREQVKSGLYTYSATLVGLGMGTFYEFSMGFWILLVLATVLAVLLSAAFIAQLGKSNLPALSLAFIFTLWVVILSSKEFAVIGLTQRNIYWLNEMYAAGGTGLINFVQRVETIAMPDMLSGFLRSLSAILFQSNIAAGILLSIGLLFFSRIALTLMVAGYTIAILFIQLMDGYAGSVNYYNLGTNFMLVSVALGGFYIIPSVRSFFWSLITVPISYILVIALWKITYTWGLPVFSLPFCITVILFLFVLQLRKAGGKMVLTPIQYYSPEENLYRFTNNKERVLSDFYYYHLSLPFMGDWTVSQGYDGTITHKGDWGKALDFVITDKENKTYQGTGTEPEQYYCYNKPVLSPADGIVEEIIDYVEDNAIGGNNTQQNWGNTIIIKHAATLYTKLSHLKRGSFKVAKGAFVKKGDILATCGSSGRSPEPHLHFQVQATPYIDSKTLAYPLAYFLQQQNGNSIIKTYSVPLENNIVGNIIPNAQLQQAFDFKPGYIMKVTAAGYEEEAWEVMVSTYNETYFYCSRHHAYAYFINNGSMFYFTHYFGNQHTLLYLFYQAAYKIVLSTNKKITITDSFSQNIFATHPLKWFQDLLAPFFIFMKMKYTSMVIKDDDMLGGGNIVLKSYSQQYMPGSVKQKMLAGIEIQQGKLHGFNVAFNNNKIEASCKN